MKNIAKTDKILKLFFSHLEAENISSVSIKNYRSDIYNFTAWLIQKTRAQGIFVDNFVEALPFLKTGIVSEYKEFLSAIQIPLHTINRRLSSLRKLSNFLLEMNLLNFSLAEGVTNISIAKPKQINMASHEKLDAFSAYLNQEKVSTNTHKNYMSDVRHFLNWLLSAGHDLNSLSSSVVGSYQQAINQTTKVSTAKRKSAAIKKFLAWARIGGDIDNRALETVSLPVYIHPPALPEALTHPITQSRPYFNLMLITFVILSSFLIAIAKFAGNIDSRLTQLKNVAAKQDVGLGGSVLGIETQGGSAITLAKILDSNFNLSVAGFVEGSLLKSTATTTSPLNVLSIVKVDKLNVDLLDGSDWTNLPTLIRTNAPDALDFTEFRDSMTLDASTNIALAGLTLSTSGTGNIDFASTGTVTIAGNVTAAQDLAVNGGDITSSATSLNISVANTGTVNFRDGSNSLSAIKDEGDFVFWNLKGKSSASDPTSCSEGDIYYNANDDTVKVCHSGNTWEQLDGGTTAFSGLTSGTNTTAAMVVGTGASLTYSGSGTITASDLTCSDCLNFSHFADSLTLDAATGIALGSLTLSTSGTGALSFASTGQVTFSGNVDAASGLDVTGANLTVTTNVGAGTTSPDSKLHVVGGDLYVAPDTGYSFDNPSVNEDAYIYGNLEVDGTIYGTLSGTFNPGFTTGSVIFEGASGLTQDNSNFFWDDTANALGIGTNIPLAPLHIALNDATTNSSIELARLTRSTTGSAATNIGEYTSAYLENDAGTLTEAGRFGFLSRVVTSGVNFAGEFSVSVERETYDDMLEAFSVYANSGTKWMCGNSTRDNGPDCFGYTIGTGNAARFQFDGADRYIWQFSGSTLDNQTPSGTNLQYTTLGASNTIVFDQGNSGANLTITSNEELVFGDTNTFIVGGHAGVVDYNVISDAGGSPSAGILNSDDDLYIEGNLEIDGADVNMANAALVVSSCSGCGGGTSVWSSLTNPTTSLTLTFDNGEDNTFSYIHSTGDHNAWTFNYSQVDDVAATDDFDAMTFNLSSESGDAGDTFDGIVINWANGVANTILDSAIKIDNAEDTAATLTDAIIITSSGVANGVTDAIDVSATNLNNAINAGANFIQLDGLRAFEGSTGTLTLEDTGGNDMIQVVDQGSTGRLAVSDSLQVGGLTTVGYSRFGTDATGHALASAYQVLTGDIEVNGILYLDGDTGSNTAGVIHNSNGTLTLKLCSQGGSGPCASTNTLENTLTQGSWLIDNNANVGKAALIVNQQKNGDIFTASASSGTTRFTIENDGDVTFGDGVGTDLTVGAGTGKINVGTVDPVYNIGGTKYATYLPSMVGVKEEITGVISTDENAPGLGFKHTIDFKNEPQGSDLWLFSKATDIKSNIGKLVVLLSPGDNTRVWYDIDENRYTLSIYSLTPTQISYRLTAPRFDYALWTNQAVDAEASTGFIVDETPLTVNNDGDLDRIQSQNVTSLSSEASSQFSVIDFVVENIKAGAIETKFLASETVDVLTATVDNLIISNGLISPVVQTNLISPLPGKSDVAIKIGGGPETATESGFGKLIIQNQNNEEVASIDTEGNAAFAGDATVSGTLYAEKIDSPTLNDIKGLLSQVETDQALLTQSANWDINTTTNAANLAISYQRLETSELYVTQTAAMNSLSLSQSLTVGSDLVIQSSLSSNSQQLSSINTLSAPLQLQSLALAPIELMAGKVRIETNGDVAIAGNLFVAGNIQSSGLDIKDNEGNLAASIDASGSARFNSLSTEKLILAGSATPSAILNGQIDTTYPAGQATIPADLGEITINNPLIQPTSLIYITPTSTSQDNILYIKDQGNGYFRAGFDNPPSIDVAFNWWVIDVQSTDSTPPR